MGSICCKVINNTTIHFPSENQTFALDFAFGSDATQEMVYEKIGKGIIKDVMNGYNGTLFSYGQTGSGKTYTMFGYDLHDDEFKGIIPRAACDIFTGWDLQTDVVEFAISCSMLEIYKENLRDLLADERIELKIKESPEKGIYVEGLRDMAIGSQEELMYWIDEGEAKRTWAETSHNAVSSRSHTLFTLEVRQKLRNDTEKRGILSLVDLAGSEKVGKFGAQGQLFQEGTKINLSLSALGNVIHALTTGLDHIPYRDSKLTRLLQESLGGNYKTTLIVTCSPHSSEMCESLNTLKFAQRAKKLQNKVQMNIKNSPDQLERIIDQLREELKIKNKRISQLISFGIASGLSLEKLDVFIESKSTSPERPSLKNIKEENNDKFFNSKQIASKRSSSSRQIDHPNISIINQEIDIEAYDAKLRDKDQEIERLKIHQEKTKLLIEKLQKEKELTLEKIRKLEITLVEEKKKQIISEEKINELERIISINNLHQEQKLIKEDSDNNQNKILSDKIQVLSKALSDLDTEFSSILKEKHESFNKKEAIKIYDAKFVDYANASSYKITVFYFILMALV